MTKTNTNSAQLTGPPLMIDLTQVVAALRDAGLPTLASARTCTAEQAQCLLAHWRDMGDTLPEILDLLLAHCDEQEIEDRVAVERAILARECEEIAARVLAEQARYEAAYVPPEEGWGR